MRAALALLLAAGLGCATPVASTLYEAPEAGPMRKIALLPLEVEPAAGVAVAPSGPALVSARVLEALNEETTLEVIPPGDALRSGGGLTPDAKRLQRDFGVDGVVTGKLRRYVEREGGPSGVTRPAAVWFELELRAVSGELLWSGVYEERQEALSDNFLTLGLAWKRGFRWVTAEELAAYGARELARALAAEAGQWS